MMAELITKKSEPKDNGKFAVEGVAICPECGNTETIELVKGTYCPICRNFRLFKKRFFGGWAE